ncbi:E3 SUMO-protein ligase ZBED1-like [Paralichthys olivaceus]|uniref:E3 SUMO-protein ligase ZBED1-like n=1 Tax=Paralichthys olivaceus TaxID=8255 RepID=UPI003750A268
MVPIATVEQVGFKKLLKTMDPRYELPSRNYFAREALPQMYNEVRLSLAGRLANVTHFALTSDMWSSRTCGPYMSVTVHFIQDWEIKTVCLQTSYFPQDHTGEHIAEALQDAIASWKLQEKHLVAITTDNGSNIVKAVELNKWLRMQCFSHRLHLAIGHGMNDTRVTRAISLCKRVDLEVLEAVQKVLKPLQDFTDALSGEEYITLSYVKPVLHIFNESLLACEEGDSELRKSIKTSIVEYLNSKYSEPATTDLLEMASFVDPRFRTTYIPSEKVDTLKHRAVLEVKTLLADQSSCQQPYLRVPTVPEPADGEAAAVAPKAKKTLASFFKQRTATTTAPTKRGAIENELSSYLQSASVESDTDPLKWWKDHECVFPALSHLAKKYLLVPASSSPSERVFSCSGNIVTCQRASLKPDAVDRLVFLAQNL